MPGLCPFLRATSKCSLWISMDTVQSVATVTLCFWISWCYSAQQCYCWLSPKTTHSMNWQSSTSTSANLDLDFEATANSQIPSGRTMSTACFEEQSPSPKDWRVSLNYSTNSTLSSFKMQWIPNKLRKSLKKLWLLLSWKSTGITRR